MRRHSSTSEGLLAPLFTARDVESELSDDALLQALLDTEAALAGAAAEAGVVPAEAADAIARACRAELFDVGELGRSADSSGNPVVPLVQALTAAVDEAAQPWVHFGTTSQDVLDTALMLLVVRAAEPIGARLGEAADVCAELVAEHRDTVMVARTLGQQAGPTTFGAKAAGWLSGLDAAHRRLTGRVRACAAVQLGGSAGTLAGYGSAGPAVTAALARRLALVDPGLPWHTDRRRLLEIADAVAAVGPATAKVAVDVTLMAQSEIAEVREGGEGHGSSSAMPHKRNPVHAVLVSAGAARLPGLLATMHSVAVHEHERATGAWHAEWETLRELLSLSGGLAERSCRLLRGLDVDRARMRANLDAAGDAVLAEALANRLLPVLGRATAHHVVRGCLAEADRRGTTLRAAALADDQVRGVLSAEAIDEAFDPLGWLGSVPLFIDRALAAHREADR